MNTKKIFWIALGVFAFGFAGSAALSLRALEAGPRTQAAWAFKTDRAPELVRYADTIVVADVVARHPGRLATSETGEDTLPFQIVEFRVQRTIKGVASSDDRIYVERAGGYDPVDQIEVEIDLDGGNFEVGGSYLLFLKEQPDTGMYYQINDQARYEVVDGRLKALEPDEDPVQQLFHRRTLPEAVAAIQAMM